jgi:hypothetical protein
LDFQPPRDEDERRMEAPSTQGSWLRYALVSLLVVIIGGAVLLGPPLAHGGFRPCQRLDAQLCADLGPGECEIWKTRLARVGSPSTQPHSWRGNRMIFVDIAVHKLLGWDASKSDNPLCADELGPQVYPTILAAVRGAVAKASINP